MASSASWWILAWTVVWSIGQTVGTVLLARGRAHKSEIGRLRAEIACKADAVKMERHEAKLTEHDRRIQSLESELPHLPTREQVHSIEIDMGALKGDVQLIGQALATNTEIARRVENYLLEAKR